MKKQHFIEVKNFRQSVGSLLEQLRYAGIISGVESSFDGEDDLEGQYSFKVHAPKGQIEETWADMNTRRMRSFGINAVHKKE